MQEDRTEELVGNEHRVVRTLFDIGRLWTSKSWKAAADPAQAHPRPGRRPGEDGEARPVDRRTLQARQVVARLRDQFMDADQPFHRGDPALDAAPARPCARNSRNATGAGSGGPA